MTTRSSPLSRSAIVGRLREAGCVFAEDEAQLLVGQAPTQAELMAMVDRRVAGTPLEHVLGWARFCGMRVALYHGVFVPRRRTEFLVHQAADLVRRDAVVVDLCSGSGAVGAALAAFCPGVQLHATDIEPDAVTCTRSNIATHGGRAYVGDLYAPLPAELRGFVDILVCNAPYVPTDAISSMPPEAREYESQVALDGGTDGLAIQRRVAAEAPQWLAPGGYLLIETSEVQAPQTFAIAEHHGLIPRVARSDEHDATVVVARRPPVARRDDPL